MAGSMVECRLAVSNDGPPDFAWPRAQAFDGITHSGEKRIMDRPDTTLSPAHAAILDKLIALVHAAGPLDAQTDKYFTNTSRIVAAHGDTEVTFAVFMRRRVVAGLGARHPSGPCPGARCEDPPPGAGRRGRSFRAQAHGNHRLDEEALGGGNGSACRRSDFPASAPTTPMKCAWPCPTPASWTCTPAMLRGRK